MKLNKDIKSEAGYSLVELIAAMGITLIILGAAVASFSGAMGTREIESSRTDALNSAQAAINIMSREISNSGYGLKANNGIVSADSTDKKLHIRANNNNDPGGTDDPGEDVTFYYESASRSVVRYDPNASPVTSGIINRVSDVTFQYYDYDGTTMTLVSVPSNDTAKVTITLEVIMADVRGQPTNQRVIFRSDVTLRNTPKMLSQY